MMDFSLDGRTALVTGGSRGIGGAIVQLFARHGAKVAIADVALAAKLEADGGSSIAVACDIADPDAVAGMASTVQSRLGPVDIVVNAAGIGGEAAFTDLSIAEWDRMIGAHLRGTFLVTKQFFASMVERKWGRVINIASQLAYKGAPGLAHYCAAKAGIVGFTRALA
jgi:3-oxoacyl-[acyl-carrier protein] reductase